LLTFGQDYFDDRKYSLKAGLVRRHVLEVLQWASQGLHENLLNGQSKKALDVGCAYGYTSRVLANLGYETCGVDISTYGTKQGKDIGGSQFIVCDAQTSMPFTSETFDLLTCFDVLEHLPFPEKALVNMFDVCKGTLVCTTPNRKVEKPIRKLMNDYDETHISVKSPLQWEKCIKEILNYNVFKVESFYDLAVKLGGKLLFKSFNIPTYGLTVRLLIKK
jgi:2-polyprenyl-3-methyl-5-hydroxy-6-metoxy-1,4-benzoquinol methylase